jgi:hypothetical protein
MNRPRPVIDPAALDDPASSIYRWRSLVAGLLDHDATRLHRRFVAMRFAAVELARRARTAPHRDDRLYVSHLVDLVAGVLAAPLSDETRRLDAERRPPGRDETPHQADHAAGDQTAHPTAHLAAGDETAHPTADLAGG